LDNENDKLRNLSKIGPSYASLNLSQCILNINLDQRGIWRHAISLQDKTKNILLQTHRREIIIF
jgi:hypothetical protein